MPAKQHLGKLEPQFVFILNPYSDVRFTNCPKCKGRTKARKLPLLIHVNPQTLIALNKTCRYCPKCDLLIAHQDEIEDLLSKMLAPDMRPKSSDDYLVIGTVEHAAWKEGTQQPKSIAEMLEHAHDFRQVRTVVHEPAHWEARR